MMAAYASTIAWLLAIVRRREILRLRFKLQLKDTFLTSHMIRIVNKKTPARMDKGFEDKCDFAMQRLTIVEIEIPPSVIPFHRDFAPSQWDLWIRIKRADVGPSRRGILARIRHCGVIRRGGIRWPSISG